MSMCSEPRSTRFGPLGGAALRFGGALVVAGLLACSAPARAFEIGVGVGPLVDLPDFRGASDCLECFGWTPWPGGRVVVPMRFELSDFAALRVAPSFEAGAQRSRIAWEAGTYQGVERGRPFGTPPTERSVVAGEYYGHFGMGALPKLEVGAEASGRLGKKGLRLTSSTGVSLGYMWSFQSVGVNTPGNHTRSGDAFVQRDPDTHCNTDGLWTDVEDRWALKCGRDVVLGNFAPGVEVSVGLRGGGERPLFATLSYSSTGFGGAPNNYVSCGPDCSQVTVPDGLWNPLAVTVGMWLGP